jgi:hypothetical protein
MMDVNGCLEQRRQQYETLLREAEERRLVRDAGGRFQQTTGTLSALVAGIRTWLSRMTPPEPNDETLIRRAHYGD